MPLTGPLAAALQDWLDHDQPTVLVRLAAAEGSTPREVGASMLVTLGATAGTIGGGRLESKAIEAARSLLRRGGADGLVDLPLGPALDQCCGGRVVVRLTRADRVLASLLAEEESVRQAGWPTVLVFGAGHVGRALIQALTPLPFQIRWIDPRSAVFPPTPAPTVTVFVTDAPEQMVALAPAGAGAVVFTHSHPLDYAITEAVLQRGDFAYCGMIGSRTKRSRFAAWFEARGNAPSALDRLTCPIGAGRPGDKRPEVIAALVAAELLGRLREG